MIIIMLSGGLGNQMFQYALYCRLKELGRDVKMDDKRGFIDDPNGRVPRLKEVFGIEYDIASEKEIRDLLDAHKDPVSIAKRKLFGRKSKNYQEKSGIFDETVLTRDDLYLDGYWQSEKYFDSPGTLNKLREEFSFNEEKLITDSDSLNLLNDIDNTESVSVHIRRGDYLNPGTIENHGGICTDKYYKDAIELMLEKKKDAQFYFFSNDIEWVKKQNYGDRAHIVDIKEKTNDVSELFLMSRCKNHILANSSFSWWSAWINDRPEKLVIVPSKWANLKNMDDIYTDRMIRI
ncbi:MAG: alpha-1,2-fucosyltransferase [Butyrivibrio sp.]|nr:alpha-1,2-fucosyltransferase [Butyrivibrio sp.]